MGEFYQTLVKEIKSLHNSCVNIDEEHYYNPTFYTYNGKILRIYSDAKVTTLELDKAQYKGVRELEIMHKIINY